MVFQLTDKLAFPDPHYGDPDGLLAVGGDYPLTASSWRTPTASSPGTHFGKN